MDRTFHAFFPISLVKAKDDKSMWTSYFSLVLSSICRMLPCFFASTAYWSDYLKICHVSIILDALMHILPQKWPDFISVNKIYKKMFLFICENVMMFSLVVWLWMCWIFVRYVCVCWGLNWANTRMQPDRDFIWSSGGL